MAGLGGHSHNDQLSFELSCGEQPLVVDPGAYLYTADPDARNLFRSTALHSTMEIDSAEQNELRRDFLFTLPDRTRSEACVWEASGDRALFEGRHHGYEVLDRPAVHTRRFELDARSATVRLRDMVTSDGPHSLAWSFPLAPCSVRLVSGGAVADFPACRLEIECHETEFEVTESWLSPSYGVWVRAPLVRARRKSRAGIDVTDLRLRITNS